MNGESNAVVIADKNAESSCHRSLSRNLIRKPVEPALMRIRFSGSLAKRRNCEWREKRGRKGQEERERDKDGVKFAYDLSESNRFNNLAFLETRSAAPSFICAESESLLFTQVGPLGNNRVITLSVFKLSAFAFLNRLAIPDSLFYLFARSQSRWNSRGSCILCVYCTTCALDIAADSRARYREYVRRLGPAMRRMLFSLGRRCIPRNIFTSTRGVNPFSRSLYKLRKHIRELEDPKTSARLCMIYSDSHSLIL